MKTLIYLICLTLTLPSLAFATYYDDGKISTTMTMYWAIINQRVDADLMSNQGAIANLIEGHKGLIFTTQDLSDSDRAAAASRGITVESKIVGRSGVRLVTALKNPVKSFDLETVKAIFTCRVTKWHQIKNSNLRGPINAYALKDSDELMALEKFIGQPVGSCIHQDWNSNSSLVDMVYKNKFALGVQNLALPLEEVDTTTSMNWLFGATNYHYEYKDVKSIELRDENGNLFSSDGFAARDGLYPLLFDVYMHTGISKDRPLNEGEAKLKDREGNWNVNGLTGSYHHVWLNGYTVEN